MNKFFSDIKTQFIFDYNNNFITLCLEIFGTITSLTGAFTLALLGASGNMYFILSFYLLGSATWAIASKRRNNGFNLLLSSCYSLVNIVGLTKLYLSM